MACFLSSFSFYRFWKKKHTVSIMENDSAKWKRPFSVTHVHQFMLSLKALYKPVRSLWKSHFSTNFVKKARSCKIGITSKESEKILAKTRSNLSRGQELRIDVNDQFESVDSNYNCLPINILRFQELGALYSEVWKTAVPLKDLPNLFFISYDDALFAECLASSCVITSVGMWNKIILYWFV